MKHMEACADTIMTVNQGRRNCGAVNCKLILRLGLILYYPFCDFPIDALHLVSDPDALLSLCSLSPCCTMFSG